MLQDGGGSIYRQERAYIGDLLWVLQGYYAEVLHFVQQAQVI